MHTAHRRQAGRSRHVRSSALLAGLLLGTLAVPAAAAADDPAAAPAGRVVAGGAQAQAQSQAQAQTQALVRASWHPRAAAAAPAALVVLPAHTAAHAPAAALVPAAQAPAPTVQAPAVARKAAPKAASRAAVRAAVPASWVPPIAGAPMSEPFGVPDSGYAAGYHTGTDFAVDEGTPVRAVAAGTVVSAGWQSSYGNTVVLALPGGTYALYAHLSSIGVSEGDPVTAGEQVALSGSTGNSTGPHLHFEIRTSNVYGAVVNPLTYLRTHGVTDF